MKRHEYLTAGGATAVLTVRIFSEDTLTCDGCGAYKIYDFEDDSREAANAHANACRAVAHKTSRKPS